MGQPLLHVSARLPHPPGINRTYRPGDRAIHTTRAARSWAQEAVLLLRLAGARIQPAGSYWLDVSLVLHTQRQDIDAGVKGALDAISISLGIDDAAVARLEVTKLHAESRAERALDVAVDVYTADSGRSE